MQPIPLPEGQKVVSVEGGYIKEGCFVPVDKEWMLTTTNYDPKDGIVFAMGESPEMKTFYMNDKGEWINIDTLQ